MKRKFVSTVKTILILSLAALAVYQVSQLWLVSLTNRDFFLYLQARFPPGTPDGQSAFAVPFRILSGAGDGTFDAMYSGVADSEEWAYGEAVLNALFENGHDAGDTSWAFILLRPTVIYEYAFEMRTEHFALALGQNDWDLLTDAGVSGFDSVAIQPPNETDSATRVFFINFPRVREFSLRQDFPKEIPPANAELHYTAMGGDFVPNAPDGFFYNTVNAENPFRDPQGLFRHSHIRGRIEPFFDNPTTIIQSVSGDNVYIFSNRNTMVRYLENAVIEYTSYRTVGRTAPVNFMTDFSAALAFINYTDPLTVNEIYLQNYDDRGRMNVFWFNYVIENRPLILAQEWYTGQHCADPLYSAIEVTVDHGRVVRYRRIAYNFSAGEPAWHDAFEATGIFTLGYPIRSGGSIELEILTEV